MLTDEETSQIDNLLSNFLAEFYAWRQGDESAPFQVEEMVLDRPVSLTFAGWSFMPGDVKMGSVKWKLLDCDESGVLKDAFQLKHGVYSIVNPWAGEELLRVMGYA